jgi:small subunit ribosomal protein S20
MARFAGPASGSGQVFSGSGQVFIDVIALNFGELRRPGVDAPAVSHYKGCNRGGGLTAAFFHGFLQREAADQTRMDIQERSMANTKSAKKATRKIARRTEVNKARRSRMRTSLRHVEAAIASGDKAAAQAALVAAEPSLFRAARSGVIHKKTASRKVSRLTHRIAKIGA